MNRQPNFKLALIALLVLPVACTGNFLGDRSVKPENRIMLQEGGPHSAKWETYNVVLDYTYTRTAGTLQFSAGLELRRMGRLENFAMDIHFVDSSGTILGRAALVRNTIRSRYKTEKKDIDIEFSLPAGTDAIAFSYSGTYSGGGDNGSPVSFWKLP